MFMSSYKIAGIIFLGHLPKAQPIQPCLNMSTFLMFLAKQQSATDTYFLRMYWKSEGFPSWAWDTRVSPPLIIERFKK